ncbi:PLP-dependent aminotransferase family protein [Aquimarina sp. I32.4]|uniref:MocR-like pyridoxine biosynthesis transcription factor PdxR n=1 Tax=Aquimarina sp. I32.4 TaxID=2053903 RepID=UPI000CDE9910|nr:PLP-dependent aminotransferase family protein [Aquimarina sp. I32.4]
MFPFKNNIILVRNHTRNLYLQLCDQIIGFIKSGKLPPSTKLPGSRKLADDLNIHRKTVIAAYEELASQGWIETIPARGTFVMASLPVIKPKNFDLSVTKSKTKNKSNFSYTTRPHLVRRPTNVAQHSIKIDDGIPDHRLAPIEEIAKVYRNITKKTHYQELLTYGSIYGNLDLRKTLATFLNQTRGLRVTIDNILITRGSQMGIYLVSQLLLSSKNKFIVVGNTNYMTADNTFEEAGGKIIYIPVDKEGLDTYALKKLCETRKIDVVYVTSHHHHPTTVTLSAKRRMHLLQLAQQYHFAIIEDDYDYDFHYSNAPILPLASNDEDGNVIYIGGFTKLIAPSMRIGYLVAPTDFVEEAARLRRIIDRQGDTILEQTLSQMITTGDIQRHCSKVLKIYKSRRDLFCKLLEEKLNFYFDFEIPKGGMAVWVKLHTSYNWDDVSEKATAIGLNLSTNWRRYDNDNSGHNGIRMGFASLNEQEIHQAIDKLVKVFELIEP